MLHTHTQTPEPDGFPGELLTSLKKNKQSIHFRQRGKKNTKQDRKLRTIKAGTGESENRK